jgi:hypothetical protein
MKDHIASKTAASNHIAVLQLLEVPVSPFVLSAIWISTTQDSENPMFA